MMSSALRALLDGPELPCDHWLYRLQEITGFDHPACAVIEEVRGLCKHFESVMPTALLQPADAGRGVVRQCLGRIRWVVAKSWERGELTPADKVLARKLHAKANDILRLLDIDPRPAAARSAAAVSPTDWCSYLSNLSQSREAIERVQADLGLLADSGIVISDQPQPTPGNVMYAIGRMKADAGNAFGGRHDYLVRRFHHDCRALGVALEQEGVIAKERAA